MPSTDSTTPSSLAVRPDAELLNLYVKAGSGEALAKLIDRYHALVYRACLRSLGHHHDAEDAAQAVWAVFCRKARQLDARRPLSPWLHRVALHTAQAARRRRSARARYEHQAAGDLAMRASLPLATSAVQAHLDEALSQLPSKFRDAIVLRHLQGLDQNEVAERLDCPVGTAASLVSRGLTRLRSQLVRLGWVISPAALLAALDESQAMPVPPGLAQQIASCAAQQTFGPDALTLARSVETAMRWLKIKATALYAAAALAVAGTAGMVISMATSNAGPAANAPGRSLAAPVTDAAASQERPAPSAGAPSFTHDWPMYIGPEGTFADPSKVSLLEDFSQARLVWKSEDKSLGWGKTTSKEGATTKRAPGFYPSGQGSLIVAGGLVIAGYYIPSGDVICKDAEGCAPEFRQRALISADDVILAVDAATGKTRWKQVFAGTGLSRAHSKRPTYGPTPAAAGGRVFHLGTTGRVYGVELATGKPIWESDIGEGHKAFEATKVKLLQERADPTVKGDGPLVMITSLVVCADVLVAPAGTKAIGFDAAGGKKLWEIAEALSGCNVPCPATVEGQAAFFCVNGKGEMRLIRAKSGEVLWTQKLGNGISHTTQPVAAQGKAFLFEPIASDAAGKKSEGALGAPVCYGLSLSGARKLWMLSAEFKHGMGYDGGPSAKIGYRDGAVYFGSLDTSSVVAVKAEDGTVLGKLSPANWGHFHLWGDRLVLIGDNSHESMGGPCTYTPYTIPDLKPAGNPYAPRGRQGVSGYILPIRDPFADGYQFMRTATGQIWCYDIRKR